MASKSQPSALQLGREARVRLMDLHDRMSSTRPSQVDTTTLVDWTAELGQIISLSGVAND